MSDIPGNQVCMSGFRDLVVWRKAHALTLAVYRITAAFPSGERFHLVSQTRRAAASVAANIAESGGRVSRADRARFLHIALGSARELEYHLILAHDLNYLDAEAARTQLQAVDEVQRMLSAWIFRWRKE
jgi:four helix bundle protein